MATSDKNQPPGPTEIPAEDLRRKAHDGQGSATGSGAGNPVPRTPAENPKEGGGQAGQAGAAPGGITSAQQQGGMKPAGGPTGDMGSLGAGGGSTGPGAGSPDATPQRGTEGR